MDLMKDLKDVFELATNATTFINELLKIKNTQDNQYQNTSENDSQLAARGNYSKLAARGNYSKLAASGNYSKLAASGYCSKLAASGNYSQLAASGNESQLAASGYYSQLAASGNYSKLAASGNHSKLAASGYYSKLESTGEKSIIAAVGRNNIVKAKKGSWITLAEFEKDANNNFIVSFVKTEYVDGENIKENVFYALDDKQFKEVQIIDDCETIICSKKRNIIKGKFLNDRSDCYIFQKDGVSAHGKTVKQAYLDWLFKTSDRDVTQYKDIDKTAEKDFNYWVIAYRTITGACSFGINNYLENNKNKYKNKMTLQEVLKATEGQYGHNTFKEFFERI